MYHRIGPQQNGRETVTQPQAQPAPGANMTEFTVSDLAGAIKRALEEGFGFVRLRGEISGFRGQHASGHCYFGLKDDKAKIDAVVWKTPGSGSRLSPRRHGGRRAGARDDVTPARQIPDRDRGSRARRRRCA